MKEKQSQITDGGIGNIIAKVHGKQPQKYKMLQLTEESHQQSQRTPSQLSHSARSSRE